MKKSVTKILAFMLVFMMAIASSPINVFAVDATSVNQSDVYLVLDNSLSMQKTDPDSLLANAAKQFFNSTPINSRVGVITYSGKVEFVGELIKKSTADDDLGDLHYDQNGKFTNIGAALTTARDTLIENDNGNAKAIVLISDGADNKSEQYNIVSEGKVIPVYCVYINDGTNDKSEEATRYLSRVAKDSGTGDYIEINSSNEIESKMDDICRKIYGTTFGDEDKEVIPVEANETVDVVKTIGKDVYTASGTISYTDEVALKITDANGNVIYDAEDDTLNKNSDVLNVEVGNNISTITLLWPDEGDYTFTVSSKIAQDVTLSFVTIDSGARLTLSDSSVDKDETITATCESVDDKISLKNASIRIHDKNGSALGSDIELTDNGDGTFSCELSYDNFTGDGKYFIVAVAETSNGQTVASGKCNISVGAKAAAPATKKGFPFFIIPIILVILVIIVLIIKKVLGKKEGPSKSNISYAAPRSPIGVKVFGSEGKGLLISQNIQALDVPNGRESELYDIISHKEKDSSLIPEAIKTMTVSCTDLSDIPGNQKLIIKIYKVEDPDALQSTCTFTKAEGKTKSVYLDSGEEIRFEWIGYAKGLKGR